MLYPYRHAKIDLQKMSDTHCLICFFSPLLFCYLDFFSVFFVSALHFDIMQYRRAKKITSISTKYIFIVTIKGCI